ncbi:MAG: class I SAM-dependent methyltransferase [Pseudomonadota bacterium]
MASRADWMGRTGQEWARRGAALELLLGPAGDAGLQHLAPAPGQRVLDLGCGAGTSTEALAHAVGSDGTVTGIDVSPDLIALAEDRLADLPQAAILEADAQTHSFDRPFDALYSRFGAMFFDDPPAAFANLHRALVPGAPAIFVAWREPARNQWASVPMTFVVPGNAGPGAGPQPGPGPFAWADPSVFRPLLQGAGFQAVTETVHDYMAEISDGDDPDPLTRAISFMMRIGPLAARLRDASEKARAEAEAFLRRRLAKHVHEGALRLRASAWIIEARA